MIPVRCFTCGKVLGTVTMEETFLKMIKEAHTEEDRRKMFDFLGLRRYCCRTVMLTSILD